MTTVPHPCHAAYTRFGGRQRGDRSVLCDLPAGHDGDHAEADTGNTWSKTVTDLGMYLDIRTRVVVNAVDAPIVARTIEINPTLLVDIDADGRVLGIENIDGLVRYPELIEVLRTVRIAGSEPSRG